VPRHTHSNLNLFVYGPCTVLYRSICAKLCIAISCTAFVQFQLFHASAIRDFESIHQLSGLNDIDPLLGGHLGTRFCLSQLTKEIFRAPKRTGAADTQSSAVQYPLKAQYHATCATIVSYFINFFILLRRCRFLVPNASLITIIPFAHLALPAPALPRQLPPKDENLQCVHVSWEQIVILILVNYKTYAMTVKAKPGEKPVSAARYNIAAVLLPFTGAMRGLIAVFDALILEKWFETGGAYPSISMVSRCPRGTEEAMDVGLAVKSPRTTNRKAS
jgi:hypothetical protein